MDCTARYGRRVQVLICSTAGSLLIITVNYLTFNTMTAVSFDADFNTISSEEYRYAMRAVAESNVRLSVLLQAPELSILNLDWRLFPQSIVARHKFVQFIRKLLGARLQPSKASSRDIFSFLQQCKDPDSGNGLSMSELSTETATFIVAGKSSLLENLADSENKKSISSQNIRIRYDFNDHGCRGTLPDAVSGLLP